MFRILIGILFFFLMLLLSLGALGVGLLRRLFGGSKRDSGFSSRSKGPTLSHPARKKREKIFDDSDGEYIDFEEIDD